MLSFIFLFVTRKTCCSCGVSKSKNNGISGMEKKNLAGLFLYHFHAISLLKYTIQYSYSQIKYPKGGERRQLV